jgi:hypothetical protein
MFNLNKYQYNASKSFMTYSFLSVGPHGIIQKIAKFSLLGTNIYNFGFGDFDPETGDISDTSTSNNGDADTIIGTLGSIIYDFTNIFNEALIFIKGTDAARTRFYQSHINKHWYNIEPVFEIWGLRDGKWEDFAKGVNYEAFMGRRKGAFLL